MVAETPVSIDPGQHRQLDVLIDELISEICDSTDRGRPAKPTDKGGSPSQASLFGTVRSIMSRSSAGTSTLERLLIAETLAGVLGDAIAPAIARVLAPRIMNAMEPTAEAEIEPSPPARSQPAERTRKPHVK